MTSATPSEVATLLRLVGRHAPDPLAAWVIMRAAQLAHESICFEAQTPGIRDALEPAAARLAHVVVEQFRTDGKEPRS